MLLRRLLALFLFVATFAVASRAQADEDPNPTGFAGLGVVTRTVSPRGVTLDSGSNVGGRSFSIDGQTLPLALVGMMGLEGGLRFGPVVTGVDIGLGTGALTGRPSYPYADLVVRPTGQVVVANVSLEAGVVFSAGRRRVRLMWTLGSEIVALSLERPGYPATHLGIVNGDRATSGPRAQVELLKGDVVSAWLVAGVDALGPANVSVGLVVASL